MKNVEFEGFGQTEDGIPVFAYTAELRKGRDLDGKFDVQFAAAETPEGDVAFVIVDRRGNILAEFPYDDDIRELLDTLIEEERFIAGINYENRGWEDEVAGSALIVMGRDTGRQFDVRQTKEFDPADVAQLKEIRQVLEDHHSTDDGE